MLGGILGLLSKIGEGAGGLVTNLGKGAGDLFSGLLGGAKEMPMSMQATGSGKASALGMQPPAPSGGQDFFSEVVGFGLEKLKKTPIGEKLTGAGLGEKGVGEVGKILLLESIYGDSDDKKKEKAQPAPMQPAPTVVAPKLASQQQTLRPQAPQKADRLSQILAQQKMLLDQLRQRRM